jgi:hypothetical protein
VTVRILVTGSREFTSELLAYAIVYDLMDEFGKDIVLVHGNARGADKLMAYSAGLLDLETESHPADWEKHGKAAGFIRNKEMVDAGAEVCIALLVDGEPCRGTRHCAGLAEETGIPVRWYTQYYRPKKK